MPRATPRAPTAGTGLAVSLLLAFDDELRLAMTRGYVGLRLGPRVLRTETAAAAAIAVLQALRGDFR